MTFKSPTRPFCRWCGKPIRKHPDTVWIEKEPSEYHRPAPGSRYVYPPEPLQSKQDCARYTNQTVLSVSYSPDYDQHGDIIGRHIRSFAEWDGESYDSEFFDSGECAKSMGYAAVRAPHHMATKAWREAVARAKESKQ